MRLPSYIDQVDRWRNEFQYIYPVTVRFSETDAFGHLNNTNAFVFFEHARIQFFKESGLMQHWMSHDGETIPVTADLQCDYMKQIFFDEQLEIGLKVVEIGNSSVEIHYMITNETKELCMSGRGRIVQVSKKTGKSTVWDETAIEALKTGIY
ncbi:hypothetical protein CR194_11030 [Salipaludibacillus keqinensis]|uniref:Uncharacterized protein n=1 Tax=Salipaludibacillus keqinensis TaxID=2045207 RepID=A0A323TFG7_9BACI|nr:thioesterase family protein [Salipaludibacillus keqinensis]PYZ93681.1 hypothetical protein CR194_11030 [Salipaludibacillus keqinensis]